MVIVPPAGVVTVSLPIAANPSWLGMAVHTQALIASPGSANLTGFARDVIQQ